MDEEVNLPQNVKDLTGLRVGRLTVKRFSHINEHHKSIWICDCDCGNKSIPKYGDCLTRKNPTRSCGCLQREFSKRNIKEVCRYNIGKVKGNKYIEYDSYYEGRDLNDNVYVIDKDDYEIVSKHTWCINDNNYFSTIIDDNKVYLHRFILGCSSGDGAVVDHINGERYDCRKSNLRKADYYVNSWNTITTNRYGAKNIRKRGNKYEVRASYYNEVFYLGLYENIDDAIKARTDFENINYGEYRRNKA